MSSIQTAREKARIVCLALERTPSVLDPRRFAGVSLCAATAGPWMRMDHLLVLTRLGLWLCAADDIADDPSLDDAEVELRLAQYRTLVEGGRCAELAFDPLAEILDEIVEALSCCPHAGPLLHVWRAQMVAFIDAMAWERKVRRRPFDLDTYLERGSESIGVAPVISAAWMLFGEPARSEDIPEMHALARRLALAVRLANDLATDAREELEGAANARVMESEPELRSRLAHALEAAMDGGAPRGTSLTVTFAKRLTRALVDHYARGDLRD